MQQRIRRYLLLMVLAWILLLATQGAVQAHAPRPSPQTDWSMFGFDASHSHYNPYENTLSVSNVGTLTLKWQTPIAGQPVESVPVEAKGILYVAVVADSNDILYAISTTSHAVLWTYPMRRQLTSTPVVFGGVVYIGNNRVYALNATTGALMWESSNFKQAYGLTVSGNLLYFGTYSGRFCAYTLTGKPKWCEHSIFTPGTAPIVNGVVYLATSVNALLALNAKTGTVLWTYALPATPFDSPTVSGGLLYFSTYDFNTSTGAFYAINARYGAVVWSHVIAAEVVSSPAIANGIVYVGSYSPDSTLYAFNALTGTVLWSYSSTQSFAASPAVANGVVYIGSADSVSDGIMYAFDASAGTLLWSNNISTEIVQDAVVVNGIVYVIGQYPTMAVYAFGLPG